MTLDRTNTTIGNYRLTRFLGAGGMGEVYQATHIPTGRTVAMKIFAASAIEARELARFYHEARVHKTLSHPNVVELHELVTAGTRPCLVMEYVDGESLADAIRRRGALDPHEALRYVRDLAAAIAHVHAAGIIHRDIKPANVKVTPLGVVKLLDFGIAKSAHVDGLTGTGLVIGTPSYLSPEQLFGEPVTTASDLWALGVLLYEMVTGRLPFESATAGKLYAKIDAATYTPPSRVTPAQAPTNAVMRRVDALVAACLTRDAARRLSSARELAARADRAMSTTAPIPVANMRKKCIDVLRRGWLWLIAGALVALLVQGRAGLKAGASEYSEPPGSESRIDLQHADVANDGLGRRP